MKTENPFKKTFRIHSLGLNTLFRIKIKYLQCDYSCGVPRSEVSLSVFSCFSFLSLFFLVVGAFRVQLQRSQFFFLCNPTSLFLVAFVSKLEFVASIIIWRHKA